MAYIEFRDVSKQYRMGQTDIHALDNISFSIEKGELCVIVGPSGAGKTTLLNLLGGMDTPTSGAIVLDGKDISKLTGRSLTEYRRTDVGFVFQFYNLIQNMTARENVELPAEICKDSLDAAQMLAAVGLEGRMDNFPAQLSGGEQQRVSIARALAKNPKIILCDEPTGALDYNTGKTILGLLQSMCRDTGKTVLIITHNTALTGIADRVIHVKNGTVTRVTQHENPLPVERIEW